MTKTKTCFVIAPIGEEGTEIRKRADQVFKHIISPVAKELGYDPEMAHHVNEPGSISTQIIDRILTSDLVVADLTDHNPNVMYELAVRHSARKPVVQIIQKGQKLPFDISQQRTISLDHKDMDSVEEAKIKLAKQIESVQKDPSQVDSPITVAVNLTNLKSSEKPSESALVEIISMLQEIRTIQLDQKRSSAVITIPQEHVITSEVPWHQRTPNGAINRTDPKLTGLFGLGAINQPDSKSSKRNIRSLEDDPE